MATAGAPLQFVPRGGPTTPPIQRKIRDMQQQDWEQSPGYVPPPKSKLVLEKEAALRAQQEEASVADMVKQVFSNVCEQHGETLIPGSSRACQSSNTAPGEAVESLELTLKTIHRSRLELEKLKLQESQKVENGDPDLDSATSTTSTDRENMAVHRLVKAAILNVTRELDNPFPELCPPRVPRITAEQAALQQPRHNVPQAVPRHRAADAHAAEWGSVGLENINKCNATDKTVITQVEVTQPVAKTLTSAEQHAAMWDGSGGTLGTDAKKGMSRLELEKQAWEKQAEAQ